MKLVCCIALGVGFAALSTAGAAPAEIDKEGKDNLITLYLMSVAADRCGFPMTTRQADSVDRAVKTLADRLRLREDQIDALYSDADVAFEKQGPKACDRNGSFVKLYKETLQKLTGP